MSHHNFCSTPLGELLGGQEYGELLFIPEERPELSRQEAKQRAVTMKEYGNCESISFDAGSRGDMYK